MTIRHRLTQDRPERLQRYALFGSDAVRDNMGIRVGQPDGDCSRHDDSDGAGPRGVVSRHSSLQWRPCLRRSRTRTRTTDAHRCGESGVGPSRAGRLSVRSMALLRRLRIEQRPRLPDGFGSASGAVRGAVLLDGLVDRLLQFLGVGVDLLLGDLRGTLHVAGRHPSRGWRRRSSRCRPSPRRACRRSRRCPCA